jgi:uncharacterized protein (DUF2141 family)
MGFISYEISLTGDCSNTNSGVLSLSVTGSSPPFAIIWNDPISAATFSSQTISTPTYNVTGLSAGSYSFILTDSDIPTNQITPLIGFYITSSSTVSIGLINDTSCNLNNGTISANTEIIYGSSQIDLFKDGALYTTINTSSNVTNFTNLPPGTYYTKVTDIGGCVGFSNTLFVRGSTNLDFGTYVVDSPYCYQGTGKIFVSGETGTPPYTYTWTNISSIQTGSSVSNLFPGNYAVTVKDFYGCSTKKTATVGIGNKLSLVNFSTTPPSCFESNGSLSVIVSGGSPPYSYNLSNGDSKIVTSNQVTFSNLQTGNYTISVTDAGLCNIRQDIYLSSARAFSILQMNVVRATCKQLGQILITLQGGFPPYYYSITNSDGIETRQTSNLTATAYSNLQPGIYTITITDSFKNCTYTEDVEILSDKNFDLTLSKVDTVCGARNGSITANVNPSSTGLTYIYSLSNGHTTTPTTATTYTFNNLYGGFYTVTVTDSENCVDSQSEVVQGSSPYQLALTPTNAFNGSGGTITAMIGNADTKFNLVWSDNAGGQTGIYLTGLTAGTYSVTLSGANGCQQYAQTTVPNIVNSSTTISFVYSSGKSEYAAAKSITLQTMMYSGYTYVTQGAQNCVLSSATFSLKVTIDTDEYTFPFYTTKSFERIPTLSYFAPILENAVLSIPYIETCTVNPDNNTVSITSQIVDGVQYYKDDTITFDILVYFNVRCLSINDVTCP